MLIQSYMHAPQARPSVLNPSLRRSESANEVVETRRRLARKTEPVIPVVPQRARAKRQTAQIYVEEPAKKASSSWLRRASFGLSLGAAATAIALFAL